MASTLLTCTSSTKPASPSDGDTLFETDTNRIIVWDNGDNLWRTYDSDGVALNTTGLTELHYANGLWSSSSATYYITESPLMHFDASIIDGADAVNNPGNGVNFATWANRVQSGSTDYDASTSTGNQEPKWIADGPGPTSDIPTVRWDSDLLVLTNEWATMGNLTQITVAKTDGTAGMGLTSEAGAGYTNTIWWRFVNSNDYVAGVSRGDLSSPETFGMGTVIRDTNNIKLYENGGTVLHAAGWSTSAQLKFGEIGRAYSVTHQIGEISEILLFESALTDTAGLANLNVIGDYLDEKYGLSTETFI